MLTPKQIDPFVDEFRRVKEYDSSTQPERMFRLCFLRDEKLNVINYHISPELDYSSAWEAFTRIVGEEGITEAMLVRKEFGDRNIYPLGTRYIYKDGRVRAVDMMETARQLYCQILEAAEKLPG